MPPLRPASYFLMASGFGSGQWATSCRFLPSCPTDVLSPRARASCFASGKALSTPPKVDGVGLRLVLGLREPLRVVQGVEGVPERHPAGRLARLEVLIVGNLDLRRGLRVLGIGLRVLRRVEQRGEVLRFHRRGARP